MKAGQLKNRVTFQKQTKDKDEFGQIVDHWVDVCTVWAAIIDVSGKEFNASQSEQSITNCTIKIRHRKDITTDMRALCNGVYYDIKGVLEDANKTQLELPCQKGVRYET